MEKTTFNHANGNAIFSEFMASGKSVFEGKENQRVDPPKSNADMTVLEFMLKSEEKGGQCIAFSSMFEIHQI
jgi:hypothetical protein